MGFVRRITHARVRTTSLLRYFACASASLSATARPHRSNRAVRELRANPLAHLFTRPARPRLSFDGRAPLLRFSSPTAHVSRVARLVRGGQPSDAFPLRRFAACLGPVPKVDQRRRSPLRFFSLLASLRATSLEPADVRDGSFDRRQPVPEARALVDRQDASPVVFDPPDGCDRRNRSARAVDDGPSQFERCRPRSRGPARVMHRRVL